jgi:hypothetical protein
MSERIATHAYRFGCQRPVFRRSGNPARERTRSHLSGLNGASPGRRPAPIDGYRVQRPLEPACDADRPHYVSALAAGSRPWTRQWDARPRPARSARRGRGPRSALSRRRPARGSPRPLPHSVPAEPEDIHPFETFSSCPAPVRTRVSDHVDALACSLFSPDEARAAACGSRPGNTDVTQVPKIDVPARRKRRQPHVRSRSPSMCFREARSNGG